jgi:hypothetical protein
MENLDWWASFGNRYGEIDSDVEFLNWRNSVTNGDWYGWYERYSNNRPWEFDLEFDSVLFDLQRRYRWDYITPMSGRVRLFIRNFGITSQKQLRDWLSNNDPTTVPNVGKKTLVELMELAFN